MSDVPAPRWENYVLLRQEILRNFWNQHLAERERSLLVVIGRGFDPRMNLGLEMLLEQGGTGQRDVLALEYAEGGTSPSLNHQQQAEANWQQLEGLLQGRGEITSKPIEFLSETGRRITSQSARDLFTTADDLKLYSDIVVDVSAMPRSVFFPLLARLLYFLDDELASRAPRINLHVLVAEDPNLDCRIREEGIEEKAEFMASFLGGFDEEATQKPKVWIPLLGEHRTTQFDLIRDLVKPDEVCPVFPSPSRNPRRSDDIVIEYQTLLFDDLRLDPEEFLFASEQNPFDVYRQMRRAILHYNRVFKLLQGCKVAVSALSSKLMSLGALLVAYELKKLAYDVGVAHIECQGYVMPEETAHPELVGIWLTGECYD